MHSKPFEGFYLHGIQTHQSEKIINLIVVTLAKQDEVHHARLLDVSNVHFKIKKKAQIDLTPFVLLQDVGGNDLSCHRPWEIHTLVWQVKTSERSVKVVILVHMNVSFIYTFLVDTVLTFEANCVNDCDETSF